VKRALFLSAAALAAWPHAARAQTVGADRAPEVEAVVVTAARTEAPLAETVASLTVIGRDTLQRRQAITVSDELARTPGVAVNRNGGPGGVTSVRIRGAEADHTVVLVDGVKLNDPASVGGGFDFATLLTGDIERIEVLRGPQSVLYGSQAIGGVVNVLTAAGAGPQARLSAEAGSRGTGYLRGSTAFGTEGVRIRIGAGAFTTEGISAFNADRGGREPDGFRQSHASARADIRLTDALALDLRAYRAESRTEFDGFAPPTFAFGDTAEFDQRGETVAYAGVTGAAGSLRNRLGLVLTELTRDTFDPSGPTFGSEGRNERLEYQGVLDLSARGRLTFGAETERSRLQTDATAFGPALSRDVRLDSAYAQGSFAPAAATSTRPSAGPPPPRRAWAMFTAPRPCAPTMAAASRLRASFSSTASSGTRRCARRRQTASTSASSTRSARA
jgi:vitamin B12 transporter